MVFMAGNRLQLAAAKLAFIISDQIQLGLHNVKFARKLSDV